jgi:hypothetical protein
MIPPCETGSTQAQGGTMTILRGRTALSISAIALGIGALGPGFNAAQDSACLGAEESGRKAWVTWDNKLFWTSFIFMWQRDGGDLHWYELPGDQRSFYVENAWRNKTYTFKIQGCESFLQPGRCSQLMIIQLDTPAYYPPERNLLDDYEGNPVDE